MASTAKKKSDPSKERPPLTFDELALRMLNMPPQPKKKPSEKSAEGKAGSQT